jgi:hypothetical protein
MLGLAVDDASAESRTPLGPGPGTSPEEWPFIKQATCGSALK